MRAELDGPPREASVRERLDRLVDRLRLEERLIVAFSGGVDSALLAVAGRLALGADALAVTAVSPSLPGSERALARRFATAHGIRHLEVCTDEADRAGYLANGADRCFHCKSALFDALAPLADLLRARVAVGTILDDLGDHRPGQRAATARGVIAPLVDAGFTKDAVRAASRLLGLATHDKPAAACLASRVAYGDPVTPELLGRIEQAEAAVRAMGFPVLRVRSHADGTVARVEVPEADLDRVLTVRRDISAAVRAAGFRFAALDLAGFRSGGMNVLLPTPAIHRESRPCSP